MYLAAFGQNIRVRRSVLGSLVAAIALMISGCATNFSTLQTDTSTSKLIYVIPEEQAFDLASSAIARVLPGYEISPVIGSTRGYSATFRFGLDTYSQQVLVFPAAGVLKNGNRIGGYYFEVSGSGTSFVQGRAKNVQIFETLKSLLQATGREASVDSVTLIPYVSKEWPPRK